MDSCTECFSYGGDLTGYARGVYNVQTRWGLASLISFDKPNKSIFDPLPSIDAIEPLSRSLKCTSLLVQFAQLLGDQIACLYDARAVMRL